MCSNLSWPCDSFRILGDPQSYYNKPIAVLTGPGAVSGGDIFALSMTFHTKARFFGKPTAGASSIGFFNNLMGNTQWQIAWTQSNSKMCNNPQGYLTHTNSRVDTAVWLTQTGVAMNRDDVVEAAIDWIKNYVAIEEKDAFKNTDLNVYPNPAGNYLIIEITSKAHKPIEGTVTLSDVNGRVVISQPLRTSKETLNLSGLPPGIYLVKIEVNGVVEHRKVVKE